VPLAEVVGREKRVDRRYFKLVQRFNIAEERDPAHAEHSH
jgi:hypothetical protein